VNFANTPDGTLLVLDMYRETIEHPASIPEPIKKHLDLTSGHDKGRIYEIRPAGFTKHRKPRLSRAGTTELAEALADPDAWWRETAQRLFLEKKGSVAGTYVHRVVRERPTALARVHALWMMQASRWVPSNMLSLAAEDDAPRVREQAANL